MKISLLILIIALCTVSLAAMCGLSSPKEPKEPQEPQEPQNYIEINMVGKPYTIHSYCKTNNFDGVGISVRPSQAHIISYFNKNIRAENKIAVRKYFANDGYVLFIPYTAINYIKIYGNQELPKC